MSAPARVVHVEVTAEPISAAVLAGRVRSSRAGAVATFEGVVRDHHAGKSVAFLEYEAYVPMAEKMLSEIAHEATARWPVEAIAVAHRTGRLEIGEASVAIAVSSAHRGDAFDALRYTIDELKARAPVWKRETGPDGSHWIEGPDIVPTES
jgi:molybdopterin synthase catalytic subunit